MKHRITSIKNAIAYFAAGTTATETRNKLDGKVYTQHRPPRGFDRMNVTMSTGITFIYDSRFWFDYVKMLSNNNEIESIVLYYHD